MVAHKDFALTHIRGSAAFRSSLDKSALFLLQHCVLFPPGEMESSRLAPRSASEAIISQKTLDRCLMRLRDGGDVSIVRGKIRISALQHQWLLDTWIPACCGRFAARSAREKKGGTQT